MLTLYRDVIDIFMNSKKRYLILFGGRGSGKTDAITTYALYRLVKDNFRIAMFRANDSSIIESNFSATIDILDNVDALDHFKYTKKPIVFTYGKGRFNMVGLNNDAIAASRVKSYPNYNMFIFEEADQFSRNIIDTANKSLRGRKNVKVILMFNPPHQGIMHWIYKKFFPQNYSEEHEKFTLTEQAIILHTNYEDNPYNYEDYIATLLYDKKNDPYEYQRLVLGNFAFERTMRVYSNFEIVNDDYIFDDSVCTFGIDWGYSDTLAIVKVWYSRYENVLYIQDEYGQPGMNPQVMLDYIKNIPGINEGYMVYADNNFPGMIELLRYVSYIDPVQKLPKSIINGIFVLRSIQIKVNSRCVNTIREFNLYEWKPHKEYEDIPDTSINPKDFHNHYMDAIRYSMTEVIGVSPGLLASYKK